MDITGRLNAITGLDESYDYMLVVDVYLTSKNDPLSHLIAEPIATGHLYVTADKIELHYGGNVYHTVQEMDDAGYDIRYSGPIFVDGLVDVQTGAPVPTIPFGIIAAWNSHQPA
jgi:hypothetical protein